MARTEALLTAVSWIACIVTANAGYKEEVLKDEPLGYWRLGEETIDDPLSDASGNDLHGTYVSDGRTGLELGFPGAIAGDPDTAVRFQTTFGFGCGDCGQGRVPVGEFLDLGTTQSNAGYLLNHLFLGGPAPLAPLAACGPDPAPDQLTCESFPPCA